jgi:hypothetical protein
MNAYNLLKKTSPPLIIFLFILVLIPSVVFSDGLVSTLDSGSPADGCLVPEYWSTTAPALAWNAGDTLSFEWRFTTFEAGAPFNDFAGFRLGAEIPQTQIVDAESVDFDSGWQIYTVVLGGAGGGDFAIFAANAGDCGVDSTLEVRNEQIIPQTNAVMTIDDVTVTETPGGTTATFTVTLSKAAGADVTVEYFTADGSALALPLPGDYNAIIGPPNTLTIPNGFLSGTIDVTINDDANLEFSENFFVSIQNPSIPTVSIGKSTGTCTITDDDQINISINDINVDEFAGIATFTVTLTKAAPVGGVTVDYFSWAGTAIDSGAGLPDYDSVDSSILPPP